MNTAGAGAPVFFVGAGANGAPLVVLMVKPASESVASASSGEADASADGDGDGDEEGDEALLEFSSSGSIAEGHEGEVFGFGEWPGRAVWVRGGGGRRCDAVVWQGEE